MEPFVERNQPEPIFFSPQQWSEASDALWEEAYRVGDERAELQVTLAALYDQARALDRPQISLLDREKVAAKETDYWERHQAALDLAEHERQLLAALAKIEEGTATPEEVMALLPASESEGSEGKTVSKRKLALQAERERLAKVQPALEESSVLLGLVIPVGVEDPIMSTDPRRIASGRNRKKLVSATGLAGEEAVDAFFHVTADTHGGKSRKPGKSGHNYVAKNGKRIRKK